MAINPSDPTSPGHYSPSQTALLLLDFHHAFVQQFGGPHAPSALKIAFQLQTWAHAQGIPIIHCLIDIHSTPFPTCKGIDGLQQLTTSLLASGGHLEAAEVTAQSEGERIFTRAPGYVSALSSPGLVAHLKEQGITSLVLAGLSTSGCVMRTAVMATDAAFVVTVVKDGCADRDLEVHKMLLDKVLPSRAYVMSAEEFREGFEGVQGGK